MQNPPTLKSLREAIPFLKSGYIGIAPTDTIFGVLARAEDHDAVTRVYTLRRSKEKKPFIMLISSIADLERFDIHATSKEHHFLEALWPSPVSVVLPCTSKKFSYLHLDTYTLAFRIPKHRTVREVVSATGPLIATSANLEGKPHANSIREARKYFGERVDFYVSGKTKATIPSGLLTLAGNHITILRDHPLLQSTEAILSFNNS